MGLETFTGVYINGLNTSNPTGSDGKDEGDNHLRGIKLVLQNTFPQITGAVTATQAELNKLDGCTATTTELNYLSGRTLTSSDDKIDAFPATTNILFHNTSAPTGWTKNTSYSDHALRLINGTISTGGTNAFSTVLNSSVDVSTASAHTHTYSGSTSNAVVGSSANPGLYSGVESQHTHTYSGTTASGGSHNHNFNMAIKYLDVILATKD